MSLDQNIQNGLLTGDGTAERLQSNQPSAYKSRLFPYFSDATHLFVAERAEYASDFFEAKAIGLSPEDPMREDTVRLRLANVVRPSATITRNFDDYKEVLIADPRYTYLRQGTKLFMDGSWWLSYNPDNISSVSASGIIRRCNATWNFLDYYGNLHREPICVEATHSNANAPNSQQVAIIPKGYFNVVCQYNGFTRQINDNTRLILGSRAYSVSGFSDFETEFTEDDTSVRLLRFAIRVEQENHVTDDMERRVADGKNFSWAIRVTGKQDIYVGDTETLAAVSVRNGEQVSPTDAHPIDYIWESDNPDVARVDLQGNLQAVAEGTANVTATLVQNRGIRATYQITVLPASDSFVAFTSSAPKAMEAYGSPLVLSAAYFEGGNSTDETVEWKFTAADESAYSAQIRGNTATIQCWCGSVTPLVVTASYGGKTATATIELIGL